MATMSDLRKEGCIGHGRFAYDAASEARRRIAFLCHADCLSTSGTRLTFRLVYRRSDSLPTMDGLLIPLQFPSHSMSACPSTEALMPLDPNFGYATW